MTPFLSIHDLRVLGVDGLALASGGTKTSAPRLGPADVALLPDSDFALLAKDPHGFVFRGFPMAELDGVKRSMAQLCAIADRLPEGVAEGVATRLIERARRLGETGELPLQLEKLAGEAGPRVVLWPEEAPAPPAEKTSGPGTPPVFVVRPTDRDGAPLGVGLAIHDIADLREAGEVFARTCTKLSGRAARQVAQGLVAAASALTTRADAVGLVHPEVRRHAGVAPAPFVTPELTDRRALYAAELSSAKQSSADLRGRVAQAALAVVDEALRIEATGRQLFLDEALDLTHKLSALDEVLGMDKTSAEGEPPALTPAHLVFLLEASHAPIPRADPIVYTQGSLIVRESDLMEAAEVKLDTLQDYFGPQRFAAFVKAPVDFFEEAASHEKLLMARTIAQRIRTGTRERGRVVTQRPSALG